MRYINKKESHMLVVICHILTIVIGIGAVSISDICNKPLPCQSGTLIPDPDDCQYFYECEESGSSYIRTKCDDGKLFHPFDLRCRIKRKVEECAQPCNKTDVNFDISAKSDLILLSKNEHNMAGSNITEMPPIKETSDIMTTNNSSIVSSTTTLATKTTKILTSVIEETITTSQKSGIIVPVVSSSKQPPYVIITDPVYQDNVTSNASAHIPSGGVDDADSNFSSIIIGIITGVVLLVILFGAGVLVMMLIFRRKKHRRSNNITKVENPHYAKSTPTDDKPHNYRFSRDSALYVGPTVNFTKLNNNVQISDEDSKKKRPAPTVPAARQHLLRKKGPAPPPPNPFGAIDEEADPDDGTGKQSDDIYEKDSNASSENLGMSTFTAKNEGATFVDKKDPANNKAESIENTSLNGNNDDLEEDSFNDKTTEPLISKDNSPNQPVVNGKIPKKSESAKEDSISSEVENEDISDGEEMNDQSQVLIDSKRASQSKGNVSADISLDDYDKSLNPFFAD